MPVRNGNEINVSKNGVLLVGEAWGGEENAQGRPFVGPAGELVNDFLSYAGLRREDVNITNVVNDQPFNNEFKKFSDRKVAEGQAALDKLVKQLKPSLIITLGNIPACHFVPSWPTGGRGVVGAKHIEDRRGYFWKGKHGGWVLTVLHPASALPGRSPVPNHELISRDFKRASRWLRGELPRQEFPPVQTLNESAVRQLLRSKALAFDIETRFGHKVFCCGFTGDSLQPYVAKWGKGFDRMRPLLSGRKGQQGVAHNGPYDVDLLDRGGFPTALYTDDTQTAWWALDPELAAQDEGAGGRMTRKGLAFIASLDEVGNFPFWKAPGCEDELGLCGYPDEDDDSPEAGEKLYLMGGRDSYITRLGWDWLYPQMEKEDVLDQYRVAFNSNLACITATRRGWLIDDEKRIERMNLLDKRAEKLGEQSKKVALEYIEENQIEHFRWVKQCQCCNGAAKRGNGCWNCAGLKQMPKKKEEYGGYIENWEEFTVAQLKEMLPVCEECEGAGEFTGYDFNPYSRHQLVKLIYENIEAPKSVFQSKEKMDEMAQNKLLLWARGGG